MCAYFSVIIPSYLGSYRHAARNRSEKIHRAIKSVFNQQEKDFEVVVIADGCEASYEAITSHYSDDRLATYLIPKQRWMSGMVRNFGITRATGKYVVYLDIDDYWGDQHLIKLKVGLKEQREPEWGFFDDWCARRDKTFYRRKCRYDIVHQCGTSNIIHERSMGVYWKDGYLHDYQFIQDLLKHSQPKALPIPEYFVCHIPNIVDI